MTVQQILEWCGQNITIVLVGLSALIQFTPIKINPWTALFKWIGNKANEDLRNEVGGMNKKIDNLVKDVDNLSQQRKEDEKDRIRWEILDFANSCRHGRRHTKDEYQHIIELNDKYKKLLKETNDKNGVFEVEYDYIKQLYKERQEKNDFL